MAIFAVLSETPNPALAAKIGELYPDDKHYTLAPNQWLIESDKLTSTIGQELGMTGGAIGSKAAVFRVFGPAWGWHDRNLWEWLSLKGDKA